MNKQFEGQNVLITCSNWFVAPDGKQYRAAWGKLIKIHEAKDALGFVPNRMNTNWWYEIGNIHIMGCQAMYIILCPNKPNVSDIQDYQVDPAKPLGVANYLRPTIIYIAE